MRMSRRASMLDTGGGEPIDIGFLEMNDNSKLSYYVYTYISLTNPANAS